MFSSLLRSTVVLATLSAAAVPAFAETAAPAPAGAQAASEAKSQKNIVETAVGAGNFTTLVKLVQAADLAETLSGPGPFTVFAPTDDAFAKLDSKTVADLQKPENKEKLATILKYHVVSGKVTAADAAKLDGKSADTVAGKQIKVKVDGSKVKINDATVTKADIMASNGVIHVIDAVMLPPAAADKQ